MPRLAALALSLVAAPALAQDRIPSHCQAIAEMPGAYLQHASFGEPVEADHVRIHYVGHATFTLETPGGLVAATDFTGRLGGGDIVPDVVTMNNAHTSHWTPVPDDRIPHVLEGWAHNGVPADHNLDLGEMLVRNLPTDVRSNFDDGVREDGNSIFIFEVAGLCIGHLGHLHHELGPEEFATIGRLDVVMVPVDAGYTMSVSAMAEVVRRLRSSVVIPMHWFSGAGLAIFLNEMQGQFDIVELDQSELLLSLKDLPGRPTIMVLQPEALR